MGRRKPVIGHLQSIANDAFRVLHEVAAMIRLRWLKLDVD